MNVSYADGELSIDVQIDDLLFPSGGDDGPKPATPLCAVEDPECSEDADARLETEVGALTIGVPLCGDHRAAVEQARMLSDAEEAGE